MNRLLALILAVSCAACVAGCPSDQTPVDSPSDEISTDMEHGEDLSPRWRREVRRQLHRIAGPPHDLRVLEETARADLVLGESLYGRYCIGCHGAGGRGDGPAAALLAHPPRDFSHGRFKYASTPYGAKPTRDDLMRTIRHGLGDLPMPAYADKLTDDEIAAVAEYVVALAQRGELLRALAWTAYDEDALDDSLAEQTAAGVAAAWAEADDLVVEPLSPRPEDFAASAAAGRLAFFRWECIRCHGGDGRGRTKIAADADDWGLPIQPPDLAGGLYRVGDRPLDLYRAIHSGVTGTPMAGLAAAVADEPDTLWNLVDFILLLDQQRRSSPPSKR